jgi:hypothetical protein
MLFVLKEVTRSTVPKRNNIGIRNKNVCYWYSSTLLLVHTLLSITTAYSFSSCKNTNPNSSIPATGMSETNFEKLRIAMVDNQIRQRGRYTHICCIPNLFYITYIIGI